MDMDSYVTCLTWAELPEENIMTNFVQTLQSTFTNCKTHNKTKKDSYVNWSTLRGKELWKHIDWSGKMSSTKNHNNPGDQKMFKFFEKLYCPENEPPIEDFDIDNEIFIPITDSEFNLIEVKDAYNQQKSGITYKKHTRTCKRYSISCCTNFIQHHILCS